MSLRTNEGQATVEAAFLIPVLFVCLLLLIQPGIILYDRMVMNDAAAEGCRLLATKCTEGPMDEGVYEDIVKRHLGAIPQQELFHIHDGDCSYRIHFEGDEHSQNVIVEIENEIELLPIFDAVGALTGLAPDGRYRIRVHQEAITKPSWYEG